MSFKNDGSIYIFWNNCLLLTTSCMCLCTDPCAGDPWVELPTSDWPDPGHGGGRNHRGGLLPAAHGQRWCLCWVPADVRCRWPNWRQRWATLYPLCFNLLQFLFFFSTRKARQKFYYYCNGKSNAMLNLICFVYCSWHAGLDSPSYKLCFLPVFRTCAKEWD